jgi:hypothetical protein
MQKKGYKIDLALLDEVKTQIETATKQTDVIAKAEQDLYRIFDTAKKIADNLEQQHNYGNPINLMIDKSIDRLKQSTKELGIDINSLPEVKKLQQVQQTLLKTMASAKSAVDAYKTI